MAAKTKDTKIDFSKSKYAVKFRAIMEFENINASHLAMLMGHGKPRISRIVNGVLIPTVQDIEILKSIFPYIDLNEFMGNGQWKFLKKKSEAN